MFISPLYGILINNVNANGNIYMQQMEVLKKILLPTEALLYNYGKNIFEVRTHKY